MNEEEMRRNGFGRQMDMRKDGRCPVCEKKVYASEMRNAIELNEFKISGLCHSCQQEYFDADGAAKK